MPHWFVALAIHPLHQTYCTSRSSKLRCVFICAKILPQEWAPYWKWNVHETAPCKFRTTSKKKKKKIYFPIAVYITKKGAQLQDQNPVLQLYLLRLQRPRDVHLPRIIYSSLNVHITAGGGAQTKIMCLRGKKKGLFFLQSYPFSASKQHVSGCQLKLAERPFCTAVFWLG